MNNVDSRSTDFLIEHQAPPVVVNFWTVLRQVVLAAVDLYIAVSAFYFAGRFLKFDIAGVIALTSEFLHYFLLSSIPVVIITLIARSYRRAALLSVHAVTFIWLYGALFVPQAAPICLDDCIALDVMTFNTVAGRMDNSELRATIAASSADIVVLQEVSPDQGTYLQRHLDELYEHQAYRLSAIGSERGLAILSSYPIIDTSLYNDPATGLPTVMVATLNVNGQALRIVNVHASPPYFSKKGYRPRSASAIAVAADIVAGNGSLPALLVGDFNATDQSAAYRQAIEAGFTDAYRQAGTGFGPTYPAPGFYAPRWLQYPQYTGYKSDGFTIPAVVRIDHIMHSEHFETASAQRVSETPSDHYPVQASIYWYLNR